MWWILYIFLLPPPLYGRMDCAKKEYEKCIKIADPLLKQAHLVFPDNAADIDQVCNIWNQFVDCLKLYTDDCFTIQQRKQFNRAVESPIASVHQMCTQPDYQKEYLLYASCIKDTIVQNTHCGVHYKLLVDQVEQGDIIAKSTLCCSHDRFKQCVQRETRQLCDRGIYEGPASKFATQIIDKALRFLQDQCLNYIPNSGDCPLHPTGNVPFIERSELFPISTSSSDLSSWSTLFDESAQKERAVGKVSLVKSTTLFPMFYRTSVNTPPAILPSEEHPTQMLGSRTRPASYGRASSWPSESNPPIAGNTVQMYPEIVSTEPTKPAWTTATWKNRPFTSTATSNKNTDEIYSSFSSWSTPAATSGIWYPAAGSQHGNEVDEPNQLGWNKPQNSAPLFSQISLLLISISMLVMLV